MFYYFPFLLYHYKLGDDHVSDDEPEAPNDDDISDDNNNQIKMMADMMSSASDFCPVGPTPAIMFGLREVTMIMMMMIIMMMS